MGYPSQKYDSQFVLLSNLIVQKKNEQMKSNIFKVGWCPILIHLKTYSLCRNIWGPERKILDQDKVIAWRMDSCSVSYFSLTPKIIPRPAFWILWNPNLPIAKNNTGTNESSSRQDQRKTQKSINQQKPHESSPEFSLPWTLKSKVSMK